MVFEDVDPTDGDFWIPPLIGPFSQVVGLLCLSCVPNN